MRTKMCRTTVYVTEDTSVIATIQKSCLVDVEILILSNKSCFNKCVKLATLFGGGVVNSKSFPAHDVFTSRSYRGVCS